MGVESNEYFDLPTLLKHGDLKIREFAKASPSITVDEYFGMLSLVLSLAPEAKLALDHFCEREGDIDDYKSLDKMVNLLDKLQCESFILAFHALLNAYGKKGNWREAAAVARQITGGFNEFYFSLLAARRNKIHFAGVDGNLSLQAYIKRWEEEEANRKPIILAVDDSPVILQTVSSILSNEYKVFTLAKPLSMETVLQKITPDLFLLDYQMPERNGFELIPIIRSFAEHKDTPIIFLTSEGKIDNVTAAIALGASDFAVKPFKADMLREKIARHIVKK